MPVMEIRQVGGKSSIYGLKIPHRRTFLREDTIVGLSNRSSGFQKDKLVVFQGDRPKYRVREIDRSNWALRSLLPAGVFLLCLAFLIAAPRYKAFAVLLMISSILMSKSLFAPQYAVLEDDVEIGALRGKDPAKGFSRRKEIYHIHSHSEERYSLFKNGTQVALYKRELEKRRNKYLICYASEEPPERIELFCLWIDMSIYDNERGLTILKTYGPPDKHPEYTSWRPRDGAARAAGEAERERPTNGGTPGKLPQ